MDPIAVAINAQSGGYNAPRVVQEQAAMRRGGSRHTEARYQQDVRRKEHQRRELEAGVPHQRRGDCNQAIWNVAQVEYPDERTCNLEVGSPVFDLRLHVFTAIVDV